MFQGAKLRPRRDVEAGCGKLSQRRRLVIALLLRRVPADADADIQIREADMDPDLAEVLLRFADLDDKTLDAEARRLLAAPPHKLPQEERKLRALYAAVQSLPGHKLWRRVRCMHAAAQLADDDDRQLKTLHLNRLFRAIGTVVRHRRAVLGVLECVSFVRHVLTTGADVVCSTDARAMAVSELSCGWVRTSRVFRTMIASLPDIQPHLNTTANLRTDVTAELAEAARDLARVEGDLKGAESVVGETMRGLRVLAHEVDWYRRNGRGDDCFVHKMECDHRIREWREVTSVLSDVRSSYDLVKQTLPPATSADWGVLAELLQQWVAECTALGWQSRR